MHTSNLSPAPNRYDTTGTPLKINWAESRRTLLFWWTARNHKLKSFLPKQFTTRKLKKWICCPTAQVMAVAYVSWKTDSCLWWLGVLCWTSPTHRLFAKSSWLYCTGKNMRFQKFVINNKLLKSLSEISLLIKNGLIFPDWQFQAPKPVEILLKKIATSTQLWSRVTYISSFGQGPKNKTYTQLILFIQIVFCDIFNVFLSSALENYISTFEIPTVFISTRFSENILPS